MKNINHKIIFILIIIFICSIHIINAQIKCITGRVTDEYGNVINDANIYIIDKLNNRIYQWKTTDKDGHYNIEYDVNIDSIIKCSYVNYETETEMIEGNNIINFILRKKKFDNITIDVSETHNYTKDEIINMKKNIPPKNIDSCAEIWDCFSKGNSIDAQYPGGNGIVMLYLKRNIHYPDSATISDVKGKVKVRALIGKDGVVSGVELIKGVNKFCDEAVIRAVKKMPKWIPALQNASYVDSFKDISVSFNIVGKIGN